MAKFRQISHLFNRVEGGYAPWALYRRPVIIEKQNSREVMVGLLGPRSQIRRYSPVYQCPNNGFHARGDSGGYRQPFC